MLTRTWSSVCLALVLWYIFAEVADTKETNELFHSAAFIVETGANCSHPDDLVNLQEWAHSKLSEIFCLAESPVFHFRPNENHTANDVSGKGNINKQSQGGGSKSRRHLKLQHTGLARLQRAKERRLKSEARCNPSYCSDLGRECILAACSTHYKCHKHKQPNVKRHAYRGVVDSADFTFVMDEQSDLNLGDASRCVLQKLFFVVYFAQDVEDSRRRLGETGNIRAAPNQQPSFSREHHDALTPLPPLATFYRRLGDWDYA